MIDSTRLDGKVAIVTGGTGGIGKGAAARLAASGAQVVICGRDPLKGQAAALAVDPDGGHVTFLAADVADWDAMRSLAQRTVELHGRIDICVVSGGGSHYPAEGDGVQAMGLFHQNVPEDVVKVIAKAALAKITPARAVVDTMIAQGSGSIVFITSEGGRTPTPTQTAVSFHAGGTIAMARVMAKELSRHHVRVNTVAISIVQDTPSMELVLRDEGVRSPVYQKIQALAPFGLAEPHNVADVIAFLASDASAFLTGATLSPTGGLTYP